jgi:predicted nucleic acid-binding protein
MIGLDCNILVQLALPAHSANSRTVKVAMNEASRGETFGVPSFVIAEFLHVVTDDRRFAPPITMKEALAWIERFLENDGVSLLNPSAQSMDLTFRWLRQFNLGRKRILDTHLAAVLSVHGIKRLMTSNPADFTVFGVFDLLVP